MAWYGEGDDSITLQDWFALSGSANNNTYRGRVALFEFADGTVITAGQAVT
jgi:hypothetical protein